MKQSTIKRKVKALKSLIQHGANLTNLDNTMTVLNTSPWAKGTKDIVVNAYADYLKSIGLNIKLPEYIRVNITEIIASKASVKPLSKLVLPRMT